MNDNYINHAAVYLITTVFMLYMTLVMLRFLLQLVRADFHNPLSQFVVKATNPPLRLMRRFIPSIVGIDTASIVLLLALQMLMIWLINVTNGQSISLAGLTVYSIAELISLLLNVYLVAIIAVIVLSWIGPQGYNPVVSLIHTLVEPVMRPARRILPPISGIDLSPILVFLAMNLIKILFIAPIADLGRSLA